jgi:hypothetical protein
MKRTIEVRAFEVTVKATIDLENGLLTRGETNRVRLELAERLARACVELPYGVASGVTQVKTR